ncbi:unnamed protein product [Paramecium sonneborni]|uniref:Uncharacterized protein n=1 Tax=Paramecium sonneborni TaxID=65129 RepID=A0A8S1K0T2_9CILI|nr:unnamed protein product [Paramecium sonneborni]
MQQQNISDSYEDIHLDDDQNTEFCMQEKNSRCYILQESSSDQKSQGVLSSFESNHYSLEINYTQNNINQYQIREFNTYNSQKEQPLEAELINQIRIEELETEQMQAKIQKTTKIPNSEAPNQFDLQNRIILHSLGPDGDSDVQCFTFNIINEYLKQQIIICYFEQPYLYPYPYQQQKYFAKWNYDLNLELIPKIQQSILDPIKEHIFNYTARNENINKLYDETIQLINKLNIIKIY